MNYNLGQNVSFNKDLNPVREALRKVDVVGEAKRTQETLRMARNLEQEINYYKCPKWAKRIVNFFRRSQVGCSKSYIYRIFK